MRNGAAIGYAMIAARMIPLTKLEVEQLAELMVIAMDRKTEYEAEEVYCKS
jgi:hypothetical protein